MSRKNAFMTIRISPEDKRLIAAVADRLERTHSDAVRVVMRGFAQELGIAAELGVTQGEPVTAGETSNERGR